VATTTRASGGTSAASSAVTSRRCCEGITRITMPAPVSTSANALDARTPSGNVTPGRKTSFRRSVFTCATTSRSRAHSRTPWPSRAA
jgi:hypothetical protein